MILNFGRNVLSIGYIADIDVIQVWNFEIAELHNVIPWQCAVFIPTPKQTFCDHTSIQAPTAPHAFAQIACMFDISGIQDYATSALDKFLRLVDSQNEQNLKITNHLVK